MIGPQLIVYFLGRISACIFMNDQQTIDQFTKLLNVSGTLTGPDGCPWDRSRHPEDFQTTVIEEAYELQEAIEEDENPAEEMGDLLYQVIFLGRIYEKQGTLKLDEVLNRLVEKLVSRHPHVFGETSASSPEDAVQQWEDQKREEEKESDQQEILSGVPDQLPALLKAYRMVDKVEKAGFQWRNDERAFEKIEEELGEWKEAIQEDQQQEQKEELGDLLFAIANVAKRQKMDPEAALQSANHAFKKRFASMVKQLKKDGKTLQDSSLSELLEYWNRVSAKASSG